MAGPAHRRPPSLDRPILNVAPSRAGSAIGIHGAGFRTVHIRKNVKGAEFFLPAGMIERASQFAAGELTAEDMLRGMDRERFISRLAYHYDQVNYIHPFREGNGRAQRVFWNRIALDAGWQLDWRPVHGEVNDLASRAACDQRDLAPLRAMFDEIVVTAPPVHKRDGAWREAERKRMSFTKPNPNG